MKAFSAAQRTAFDLAKDHISNQIPTQLIMLLIGDGGSGKSYVTQALCKFAFLIHGKQDGKFPSVMLDSKQCPFKSLTKPLICDEDFSILRQRLEKSILIVIEDVNFISLEELHQISTRLAAISGKTNLPFGGFHVIMVGDLEKCDSSTLQNGGTHILSCPIMKHKHKAVAGQAVLIDALTHCIDITNSAQATFTSIVERLLERRMASSRTV
jgi:GTPase SAR1 family protein